MNEWMALMRPSMTSRTWMANAVGWPPALVGPVDGNSRGPVRVDRRERVVGEGVDGDQPRPYVIGSAQPEIERRHLDDGVLAEQAHERLNVVAFEGVDVGGQELTVVDGGLARCRVAVGALERRRGPGAARC